MAWKYTALPNSSNMLISGQSQSGKSYFTAKLLMNNERMFQTPPSLIIYSYRHWQPIYSQMEDVLKDKIKFISHVPTEEEITNQPDDLNGNCSDQITKHAIFCAEDWMDDI